jgi:hypothetical protein
MRTPRAPSAISPARIWAKSVDTFHDAAYFIDKRHASDGLLEEEKL